MSLLEQARKVTGDLARTARREATHGKLEVEARRIESRIGAAKKKIGEALYPLLDAGSLAVDMPEVREQLKIIRDLHEELQRKRADIATLEGHDGLKRIAAAAGPPDTAATEVEIGRVNDYFAKVGVAGIDLTGELSVGDLIHVKGHTSDFTQRVESMQIEHEAVQKAGAGASVGIKVGERCHNGDHVYRVAG